MVEPEFVKDPDAFARIKPAKSGKKISLSEDNITKPKAPDIHRNMKLLLKIHNKPSILFKDFKNKELV